jgi:uncharacterized protein (TIGR02302 family)
MKLLDPQLSRLPRAVQARLLASWLAATWERIWARLWLPASVAGICVAIILTDVLPSLPGWLHVLALVAASAGLGLVCVRAFKGFRWPTLETAKTRLETDSGTTHRPLTAAQDQLSNEPLATATPFQKELWSLHQLRAKLNLANLRSRWPAPGVAARDPMAMRALAIVIMFVALAGSWGDMTPRLERALWPAWDDDGTGPSAKVWITPPAYTGRSPIFVESPALANTPAPASLDVAEKSKLLVVVTGTGRDTTAVIDDSEFELERLADNSQRLETDMPSGKRLEIRQRGRTLGAWTIEPRADLPPNINFAREPREAGRWRLRLDYRAADDYGLESVKGRIVKGEQIEASAKDPNIQIESIDFELVLPPFNPREASQASLHDLTAHPWAGQRVLVQLIAQDLAGQSAPTEFREVVLPERVFQHPVAKALIDIRKGLMTDIDATLVPAFRQISMFLQSPESFGGDPRVVLELATAKYRLAYDNAASSAATLPPILWAAAVRIEDGNLAVAEQRLDAAEKALQDAMERGAPAEEIARLIEDLKRAIGEYAKELASRSPDSDLNNLQPQDGQRSIGPEELSKMMDQMRQMAQMGAKDAAREMMSQVQNMLQALRSAATNSKDNPDVKQAQEIMRDMKSLTAEQAKLLDETFKQARDAQTGKQGDAKQQEQQQKSAAERQEKLRRELGDLMGRMAEAAGQVPDSMGDADQSMRNARDALNAGALKQATDAEAQALAQLQDSMKSANDQLMQALAEKGLAGMVSMPGEGQEGNDPLGQRNGQNDDTQVEIPELPDANSMSERVRAILEELQRRAADRTRPADEQDYLRRLMKQF